MHPLLSCDQTSRVAGAPLPAAPPCGCFCSSAVLARLLAASAFSFCSSWAAAWPWFVQTLSQVLALTDSRQSPAQPCPEPCILWLLGILAGQPMW